MAAMDNPFDDLLEDISAAYRECCQQIALLEERKEVLGVEIDALKQQWAIKRLSDTGD